MGEIVTQILDTLPIKLAVHAVAARPQLLPLKSPQPLQKSQPQQSHSSASSGAQETVMLGPQNARGRSARAVRSVHNLSRPRQPHSSASSGARETVMLGPQNARGRSARAV